MNLDELKRLVLTGQMSRRQLLKSLIAVGGVAALAGTGGTLLRACGGTKAEDSFPPVNRAITGNKMTLRVLMAADYSNAAPFKALFADFMKAYPNIDVDVSSTAREEIPGQISAAATAGTPYDLAYHHAFVFGNLGMAENVDDLWARWGKEREFLPNALQDVTWGGKKFGVPLDVGCLFCIFNKDLFTSVGAAPPTATTTYPQLLEQLLKFQEQPVQAVGLSTGAWSNFGLIRANGGDLLNAAENGPTLNDPKTVAALRWNSDLATKYHIGIIPASNKRQDQPLALFEAKKIALLFTGPGDLPDIRKSGINFGTAELPKGMDGSTNGSVLGGGSFFIGKGSRHRVAAFEFLKWATAKPHQLRMVREMGRWPVLASLYADKSIGVDDPTLQPYLNQLKTAKPYRLEAYPDGDQAWSQAVAAAYAGTDPQKALDEAQTKAAKSIK